MPKRAVAVFAACSLMFSIAFPGSASAGFWEERRSRREPLASPDVFSLLSAPAPLLENSAAGRDVPAAVQIFLRDLSPSHARLDRFSLPRGAVRGTVFVLQDVHRNLSAQRHISKTMESFVRRGVGLVALEGAAGPVDLRALRAFPDRAAIRAMAGKLLASHALSGPLEAMLSTNAPLPPVEGVEDISLYHRNIQAWLDASPLLPEALRRLSEESRRLSDLKKTVYSSRMAALDGALEAYHERGGPLSDYVSALSAAAPAGPMVRRYLALLRTEKGLDLAAVEKERLEWAGLLSSRLGQPGIESLARMAVEHRSADNGVSLYRVADRLGRAVGVSLDSFPRLTAYVSHAERAQGLDKGALLEELPFLEAAAVATSALTGEESSLAKKSARLRGVRRLLGFSLSPSEWVEYKREPLPGLDRFEAFYAAASARDGALSSNLLAAIQKHKTTTAVLVAGGFHAEGLEEHLLAAGFAVARLSPVFEAGSSAGAAYLTEAFGGQPSPFAGLLGAPADFLSDPPFPPETRDVRAPLGAAAFTAGADDLTAETDTALFREAGGSPVIDQVDIRPTGEGFRAVLDAGPERRETGDDGVPLSASLSKGSALRKALFLARHAGYRIIFFQTFLQENMGVGLSPHQKKDLEEIRAAIVNFFARGEDPMRGVFRLIRRSGGLRAVLLPRALHYFFRAYLPTLRRAKLSRDEDRYLQALESRLETGIRSVYHDRPDVILSIIPHEDDELVRDPKVNFVGPVSWAKENGHVLKVTVAIHADFLRVMKRMDEAHKGKKKANGEKKVDMFFNAMNAYVLRELNIIAGQNKGLSYQDSHTAVLKGEDFLGGIDGLTQEQRSFEQQKIFQLAQDWRDVYWANKHLDEMNIPNPLHHVSPAPSGGKDAGVPFEADGLVEIGAQSSVKVELDEHKTGRYIIDRLLSWLNIEYGRYPGAYGFFPQTLAGDGDPVDFILYQDPKDPRRYRTGEKIRMRVLGMINMEDGGDPDYKLLAVPADDIRYAHVRRLEDFPPGFIDRSMEFFRNYKSLEKKKVKIDGVSSADQAEALFREGLETYQEHMKDKKRSGPSLPPAVMVALAAGLVSTIEAFSMGTPAGFSLALGRAVLAAGLLGIAVWSALSRGRREAPAPSVDLSPLADALVAVAEAGNIPASGARSSIPAGLLRLREVLSSLSDPLKGLFPRELLTRAARVPVERLQRVLRPAMDFAQALAGFQQAVLRAEGGYAPDLWRAWTSRARQEGSLPVTAFPVTAVTSSEAISALLLSHAGGGAVLLALPEGDPDIDGIRARVSAALKSVEGLDVPVAVRAVDELWREDRGAPVLRLDKMDALLNDALREWVRRPGLLEKMGRIRLGVPLPAGASLDASGLPRGSLWEGAVVLILDALRGVIVTQKDLENAFRAAVLLARNA